MISILFGLFNTGGRVLCDNTLRVLLYKAVTILNTLKVCMVTKQVTNKSDCGLFIS